MTANNLITEPQREAACQLCYSLNKWNEEILASVLNKINGWK